MHPASRMPRRKRPLVARLVLLLAFLVPGLAEAQDQDAPGPRSTGLPVGVDWAFNFDAAWGSFGFANSLYTDPKQEVPQDLGDHWFEGFIKPALSATYTLASSSEVHGHLSAVGEQTYGSAPELVGNDYSSFKIENLSIGWRSGKSIERFGENALEFEVGRTQYNLGHGLLLWDGAAEGGSRGGYWSNARKAFAFAAIGRFKPGLHTVESFYLKKDDLPEHQTGTELWGANYEYRIGEHSTLGGTYMKFWAQPGVEPQRDGLNVFNARAYVSPWTPDLSLEFEYAAERNADALDANAWNLQGAYEFSTVDWKPKLSYRYAHFDGDDPSTPRNEAFDSLLPGFYDWGTWWQGEIAGEYFLPNSNLDSQMVRAHVTPHERLDGGVIFYTFTLPEPASYAPGVTDSHLAFEMEGYADWKINGNFTATFVGAFADPGIAVQQSINRTKNFLYGMVFLAYSY